MIFLNKNFPAIPERAALFLGGSRLRARLRGNKRFRSGRDINHKSGAINGLKGKRELQVSIDRLQIYEWVSSVLWFESSAMPAIPAYVGKEALPKLTRAHPATGGRRNIALHEVPSVGNSRT